MQLQGVVELTGDMPPRVLESLAIGAYGASNHGVVALLLDGVAPPTVNRALDGVVHASRCQRKGVWYIDRPLLTDHLLPAVTRAKFVVIASRDLAVWLVSMGIATLPPEQGIRLLARHPGYPPSDRIFMSARPRRDTTTV